MRRLIPLLLTLAVLASCKDDRYLPAFTGAENVCLMQKGKVLCTYDPATYQIGFNRNQGQFRVHTDNMSDYFIVNVDSVPSELGQEVNGSIIWTTATDIFTKRDITLELVRVEGDKLWLWASQGQIGAVVRVLE